MQPKIRKLFFVTSALLLLCPFASAQARADKTLSPYFYVQGDPSIDGLPLKDTRVEINISGVIADVVVLQKYRNEGSRPINARYVFPASTRAAVYAMRMQIGDQVIIAKIKEREKARQEFDSAKAAGKSASLLEQDRPNVFSMNLANITPGDTVDIELRYTELLVPTDGIYEMVYPTVVGPRYSSDPESSARSDQWIKSPYFHQGQKPSSELHISARVSSGVPLQDFSCSSHQISAQWESASVARLTLDDSDPFQGNRDFILRYRLAGGQITSGLILYRGQDENFFLYMAQPPQRIEESSMPAREYIFVIDVSGSMEGFPLTISKNLLRNLLRQLRPSDMFNIVLFAGDSTVLSDRSLPADAQNVSRAIRLIEQQRGSGGTELLPAIQKAMALPRQESISRSIVLVTDGYVSGEQGVFDYVRAHLDQCNVFPFGIGTAVNRYLMEGVAKAGMGETFIVTQEGEAPAAAAKFLTYIQSPVLTDIHIRANGFDTYDVQPAKIPDLFAQRPIIYFGKWRGEATGTFELVGKSGFGDYTNRVEVSSVLPDEANRALRYLWARSRIADLSDYGASSLDADRIAEITNLGLQYNLLTKFTSFIAVREMVINPNGQADDVDQPLPLPLGVSDQAVGTQTGSEPELLWLIAAALLAGTFAALRAQRRLV